VELLLRRSFSVCVSLPPGGARLRRRIALAPGRDERFTLLRIDTPDGGV
jgi:hypothetical protein